MEVQEGDVGTSRRKHVVEETGDVDSLRVRLEWGVWRQAELFFVKCGGRRSIRKHGAAGLEQRRSLYAAWLRHGQRLDKEEYDRRRWGGSMVLTLRWRTSDWPGSFSIWRVADGGAFQPGRRRGAGVATTEDAKEEELCALGFESEESLELEKSLRRVKVGEGNGGARAQTERAAQLRSMRARNCELVPRIHELVASLKSIDSKLREIEEAYARKEAAFCTEVPRPRLRFECSMLQTPVYDAVGRVSWLDVSCTDEDDLQAFWSRAWLTTDFVEGDAALFVPVERPKEWQSPSDLFGSRASGCEDGNGAKHSPSSLSSAGEICIRLSSAFWVKSGWNSHATLNFDRISKK